MTSTLVLIVSLVVALLAMVHGQGLGGWFPSDPALVEVRDAAAFAVTQKYPQAQTSTFHVISVSKQV